MHELVYAALRPAKPVHEGHAIQRLTIPGTRTGLTRTRQGRAAEAPDPSCPPPVRRRDGPGYGRRQTLHRRSESHRRLTMNSYPTGVSKHRSPAGGANTAEIEKTVKKITDIPKKIAAGGNALKRAGKFAKKVLG